MTKTELDEAPEGLAADVKRRVSSSEGPELKSGNPRLGISTLMLETKKTSRQRKGHVWRQVIVLLISVSFICTGILLLGSQPAKAQDDYTFGSETVNKGASTNPSYKDTENAQYNELKEGDQYADTNYSGSSEAMTYGTTGGGAFSSALDTDDATRRNYIEANLNPAAYNVFLVPTSDVQAQWDVVFPASPTTHFDKLDDPGTVSLGDSDSTYVDTSTVTDQDWFGMSDMSDPGAGYSLTVTIYLVHKKVGGSQSANIQAGLRIGTTNYQGVSINPTQNAYVNTSSSAWATNPAGGAWTFAAVNALNTYIATSDISPVPYATKLVLKIAVTYPTANYQMQGTLTYSNVLSTAQTTGYQVLCQGYRSASENFNVQAWNYTSGAWVTKVTVNSASDTDFNFNLLGWAANCERSTGNVVQLRLIDVTGSDTTQDTLYLDLLKIRRIEQGYQLDVVDTCTVAAQYGNITLRIKAYTTGEQFNVNVWNYTSSAYDTNKLAITSLSNAWQTTIDLCDTHHRSTQTVKVQFVDATAAASDQVQDTLYLDVLWVTRYHTNPSISAYGRVAANPNLGDTITWWMTYSDYDNEAPSSGYPKVHVDSTDYSMTENGTDTVYWDGKLYHFTKDDLAGGAHTYYFIAKDANSIEITTAETPFKVNRNPTLTVDAVTPATGSNGESFSFYVTYTDADGDPPSYLEVNIATIDYVMVTNGTGTYLTGAPYHYEKAMAGGTHAYYFKTKDANGTEVSTTPKNLDVNNAPILSSFSRLPGNPVYINTELTFSIIYTDIDGDVPSSIKWRETGVSNLTMTESSPGDTDVTDGKQYEISMYLSHGLHSYDFGTSDGMLWISGGSDSITVQNRAPTIDNKLADTNEYRNTYWEHEYAATDLDGDGMTWEKSTNASFLSLNSGTGLLYGTTSDPVGWYDVMVWCNDSYGGSDSDHFKLYVDNLIPVITNGPGADPSDHRNSAWYYVFEATDADTDTIGWERSGLAWLTIDSSGNLSGMTSDTPGSYAFTIYANDSYGGSDSYAFTLHVNNRVPLISSSGNTTQTEGTYLAYHILASDDDGDLLSYAMSTNASWTSISGSWVNGTATGVGWYEFDVWANDSYDSDMEHWHLTVEAALENLAPYFTSEPICNWPNNTGYLYNVEAVDPESQPLYYDLFGDIVTEGFCTIDHETGQITGIPHKIGDFSANISVFDSVNTAWQNWSLHIYTNMPIIDSTPIETWQNGTAYLYEVHAHDPENETLAWVLEGNCTPFLMIDATVGNITNITGSVPSMGWWYVNVSVFDGYNVVWQNFTLTALNTAPSFTTSPVISGEKNVSYYYNANAEDLNNDTLTFSLVEEPGWIFIDEVTGEVEGTPTEYGVFSIKLRIFDGIVYSWQNYTLTIPAPEPPVPPIVPPEQSPSLIGVIMMMTILALAMGLMFPLAKRRQARRKNRLGSPKVAKDKEMEHGKRG